MSPRPLWIAGRFLSRLPFPDPGPTTPLDVGRSVPWYPLIGLIMGGLLALSGAACGSLNTGVAASLTLMLWVWSSGALHLDGIADSADAWVGGIGSRERTLEIMKDPRSGPAAVTVIGLVLLAKWSALQALIGAGTLWPLLIAPMLGRAQLPLLLLTTAYARTRGMASDQVHQLPRRDAWLAVAAACSLTLLIGGLDGAVLAAAAFVLFLLGRRAMRERLGGFTGDTAGALVELTETLSVLLCAALL